MTSGNWPSSVPEMTVLEGRLGIAPTETMEEAQKLLAISHVKIESNRPLV